MLSPRPRYFIQGRSHAILAIILSGLSAHFYSFLCIDCYFCFAPFLRPLPPRWSKGLARLPPHCRGCDLDASKVPSTSIPVFCSISLLRSRVHASLALASTTRRAALLYSPSVGLAASGFSALSSVLCACWPLCSSFLLPIPSSSLGELFRGLYDDQSGTCDGSAGEARA